MSTLAIVIACVLVAAAVALIGYSILVSAGRADDDLERMRRERERREALKRISGGPGSGWRRR